MVQGFVGIYKRRWAHVVQKVREATFRLSKEIQAVKLFFMAIERAKLNTGTKSKTTTTSYLPYHESV